GNWAWIESGTWALRHPDAGSAPAWNWACGSGSICQMPSSETEGACAQAASPIPTNKAIVLTFFAPPTTAPDGGRADRFQGSRTCRRADARDWYGGRCAE